MRPNLKKLKKLRISKTKKPSLKLLKLNEIKSREKILKVICLFEWNGKVMVQNYHLLNTKTYLKNLKPPRIEL
jgi:hypothetical protein